MTFAIPVPQRSNYKVEPINQAVRTDMEFGAARVRRRTSSRLDNVTVEWIFSPNEMSQFRTWYENTLSGGVSWFELTLNVGDGMETLQARFTGPGESVQVGSRWKVSATVEVRNA